jgi:hypothetical protein
MSSDPKTRRAKRVVRGVNVAVFKTPKLVFCKDGIGLESFIRLYPVEGGERRQLPLPKAFPPSA